MLNKTILIAELQLLTCGTGDKFNAKKFAGKIKELVPKSYLINHTLDTVMFLRNIFGVSSYISSFGSLKNEVSCCYDKDDDRISLNEKLEDDRKRMFLGICAAKLILWEVMKSEKESFWFYNKEPLYKNLDDKKVFDLAIELLVNSDRFRNEALDCKLDKERLCRRLNLPLPMILSKLITEDLMR